PPDAPPPPSEPPPPAPLSPSAKGSELPQAAAPRTRPLAPSAPSRWRRVLCTVMGLSRVRGRWRGRGAGRRAVSSRPTGGLRPRRRRAGARAPRAGSWHGRSARGGDALEEQQGKVEHEGERD